ncbi:hypothetical protein [Austwickia chelonae]|uniref:hypothetical protein n=1 Tax=Austwickia chelonae TaxID=100225 RepID=UPI000E267F19|nr:hypothetical protein [Austwickia chelonae]
MQQPWTSIVLIPLTILSVGASAVVAVEFWAGTVLSEQTSTFARSHLPGQEIRSMNVRGRPYFRSRQKGEVSLAYVDMAPPSGASEELLLVHNLTDKGPRSTNRLLTLPYAEPRTRPVHDATDGPTDTATVDGRQVIFTPHLVDGMIRVTASHGVAPTPVRLSSADGYLVERYSTSEEGIVVEVTKRW